MALNRMKNNTFGRSFDKVRYLIIARRMIRWLSYRTIDKHGKKHNEINPLIAMTSAIISLMVVYHNDFSRDGVLYEL